VTGTVSRNPKDLKSSMTSATKTAKNPNAKDTKVVSEKKRPLSNDTKA